MDTSTMSFSERDSGDRPVTRSFTRERPHPVAWHTRLISPLTKPLRQAGIESAIGGGDSSAEKPTTTEAVDVFAEAAALFEQSRIGYSGDEVESPPMVSAPDYHDPDHYPVDGPSTILIVFIPILVVILTVLLGVLIFLIALLCMRRQNRIRLIEDGGPLDLSKSDGVLGEGGVDGVEARWLETVDPEVREAYRRAKDWQLSYPPSSVPTDITLSQFLSIQEKGVAAWAFEPDYEENLSLYVQSRTEVTFLSDGPGMSAGEGGGNSVMANLPLPKLNEVYYWEVKMYEKPATTEVAIGLATKPYPSFRLPGWNRFSVAYFASDGFKSHNYPFTASSYGPPLAEGDVLGVGYRPRSGTVFFTRNGRKLDDCYTGLNRLNLFPTVGANGPCTLHINLGQAGFVFIEANVKKWGLAPMVGTLAPPPAYGSERGSILLDAGYGTPGSSQQNHGGIGALLEAARNRAAAQQLGAPQAPFSRPISAGPSSNPPSTPRSSRRHRKSNTATSIPVVPSPLRAGETAPLRVSTTTRRQPSDTPEEEDAGYVSPTDEPQVAPRVPSTDLSDVTDSEEDEEPEHVLSQASSLHSPNPPTPNVLDISMHSLRGDQSYFHRRPSPPVDADRLSEATARANGSGSSRSGNSSGSGSSNASGSTVRAPERSPSLGPPEDSPPPPGYAPLDPHVYSAGLPNDLPEELINQAIAAMSDAPAPQQQQRQEAAPSEGRRGPLGWILGRG